MTAGDDSCARCDGTGNTTRDNDNGLFIACSACGGHGRSLEARITLAFDELTKTRGKYCASRACRFCFDAGFRAAMIARPVPAGKTWSDD